LIDDEKPPDVSIKRVIFLEIFIKVFVITPWKVFVFDTGIVVGRQATGQVSGDRVSQNMAARW
jgi:hypothetical protein